MPLYRKLKSLRIVLVEDDEMLRDSLCLFFRTKGCAVEAFAGAEEAEIVLESEPADILICDNWLPGMDGLTLLRNVGERHPATIRILVSAYPNPLVTEEAKRAGIDQFILKPFSVAELERTLARLVEAPAGTEKAGSREEAG